APTLSRPPRPRPRRLLGGPRANRGTLGPHRLASRRRAIRCAAPACGVAPLARQRLARCAAARLALEDVLHRPRYARPPLRLAPALPGLIGVLRALACAALGRAPTRRRQVDAGAARLGQADRDRLLGRSRAMLAVANLVDLGAHEFARLGRG